MTRGPGFLLVDKQAGWTSHDVVAKVRTVVDGKVGHAGTLDPMATGLLVLGIRGATKLLRFVQGASKEYLATVQLGVATDSLDADGAILSREPMPVTQAEVERVMHRFRGEIMQIPPMVSARKVEGRRLHEMARRGMVVEREARPVTIHRLDLIDFMPSDYPEFVMSVVCSTGTYIRTLGDDIARALGGRAHLSALRRVRNGDLHVDDAVRVDIIVETATAGSIDSIVVPPSMALRHMPSLTADPQTALRVRNGAPIAAADAPDVPDGAFVRMLDGDDRLVAVYRRDQQQLKPEVVLS
ncbi:MAG: tRNA pseudouridine(55) synthase TruB [Acidimicrobiia bacterium]